MSKKQDIIFHIYFTSKFRNLNSVYIRFIREQQKNAGYQIFKSIELEKRLIKRDEKRRYEIGYSPNAAKQWGRPKSERQ